MQSDAQQPPESTIKDDRPTPADTPSKPRRSYRRRWLLRGLCGIGIIGVGSFAMLAMADRNFLEEVQKRDAIVRDITANALPSRAIGNAFPVQLQSFPSNQASVAQIASPAPRVATQVDQLTTENPRFAPSSPRIAATVPQPPSPVLQSNFPGQPSGFVGQWSDGAVDAIAGFVNPNQNESERQIRNLVSRIKSTRNDDDDSQQLDELKSLLAEVFEQKHQQQLQRLDRIRAQLDETEATLKLRESKKDEIIERRLRELLGQRDPMNFNWEYQGPSSTGLPRANFSDANSGVRNLPALPGSGRWNRDSGNSSNRFFSPADSRRTLIDRAVELEGAAQSSRARASRSPSASQSDSGSTRFDRTPSPSGSRDSGQNGAVRGLARTIERSPEARPQQNSARSGLSLAITPTPQPVETIGSVTMDASEIALRLTASRQQIEQAEKLREKGIFPTSEYERLRAEVSSLERSLAYLVRRSEYELQVAETRLSFAQRKLSNLISERDETNSRNDKLRLQREQLTAEEELSLLKLNLETAVERLKFVKQSLEDSTRKEDSTSKKDTADQASDNPIQRTGELDRVDPLRYQELDSASNLQADAKRNDEDDAEADRKNDKDTKEEKTSEPTDAFDDSDSLDDSTAASPASANDFLDALNFGN